MTQVIASRGTGSMPAPGNPQTVAGNAVLPTVAAALVGSSIWPSNPNAYAGAVGNLILNGVTIAIDTTKMKAENVVAAINGSAAGVTATISPFSNRLMLTSSAQFTIAGTDSVLVALGFTAGTIT